MCSTSSGSSNSQDAAGPTWLTAGRYRDPLLWTAFAYLVSVWVWIGLPLFTTILVVFANFHLWDFEGNLDVQLWVLILTSLLVIGAACFSVIGRSLLFLRYREYRHIRFLANPCRWPPGRRANRMQLRLRWTGPLRPPVLVPAVFLTFAIALYVLSTNIVDTPPHFGSPIRGFAAGNDFAMTKLKDDATKVHCWNVSSVALKELRRLENLRSLVVLSSSLNGGDIHEHSDTLGRLESLWIEGSPLVTASPLRWLLDQPGCRIRHLVIRNCGMTEAEAQELGDSARAAHPPTASAQMPAR